MNNPGQKFQQIAVDGYNGDALKAGAHIVEYPKGGFDLADADRFVYVPNQGNTKYDIVPTTQSGATTAPLILGTRDNNRTLEFYINDGVTDSADTDKPKVTVGQRFNDFPEFKREGYYLAGWALTRDAYEEDYVSYYNIRDKKWYGKFQGGSWTEPAEKPVYTVTDLYNQKLYAIWKPYTLMYDLGKASVDIPPMADGIGPKVEILGPAANSYTSGGVTYTFLGWTDEPNGTVANPKYAVGQIVELQDTLTLYAVWQADQVKVTFDFNGGSDKDNQNKAEVWVKRGESFTIPNYDITRTNHVFAGWSYGEMTYQTGGVIKVEGDVQEITLKAVWKTMVEIKFDLKDGGTETLPAVKVVPGSTYTIDATDPVRDGYRFMGWSEEQDATADSENLYLRGEAYGPVNEDTTLYAVWESAAPNLSHTMTFQLDGGTWPNSEQEYTVADGYDFDIPAEVPVKEAYTFDYWKVSGSKGSYPDGTPGGKIKVVHEDLIFTPVWKEKEQP